MLDKHLIAKTSPSAKKESIIRYLDYRITVLKDRLFRIEKSKDGYFTDEATQSVWFRDQPIVNYVLQEAENGITVTTDKLQLFVANDYKKSYCLIDGKKVFLNNKGNLMGTYRTLDCYNGSVNLVRTPDKDGKKHWTCPVETGVCSKSGVAIVDDKDSLLLLSDGTLETRRIPEVDDYVFAFGNDYGDAVKALYDITGHIPMIPRFALGNWWSRYHDYTQDEYINTLRRFEERDIPLTVATIDMDWHYSNNIAEELNLKGSRAKEEYGTLPWCGWTGYSWNKNLFPDYKKLLKDIKKMNLKITLNLHPKDGVRFFEDQYEDMCQAMGKTPDMTPVEFDITDDNFINNYFKILHKPYENDGVDFWWIDWQQGTETKKAGLDPLWSLNHYHYLDNAVNHDKSLILSRYCKIGSHRYPLGFSGDTAITFATLDYLPYFTATASNVGYTWWSHDIGGHMCGETNNELFARSIQYGAFSPIMRLHSSCNQTITKEPWYYTGGTGNVAAEYLRYRHSMIPYIYSENYKVHTDGTTLIKPLYYLDPKNENAYNFKNEYYFGDLLVCPITKPAQSNKLSELEIWLPEGRWTDIFTGETYFAGKGGKTMKIYRWLDTIPVFAKAGTILPLSGDKHTNSVENPQTLALNVFEGNGEYKLYEDKDEKSCFTVIKTKLDGDKSITTVTFEGDLSVIPENRTLKVHFMNCDGCDYEVLENGKPIAFEAYTDEHAVITVDGINPQNTYTFTVNKSTLKGYLKTRTCESLKKFEHDGDNKQDFLTLITKTLDAADKKNLHLTKENTKSYLQRIYELCGLYNIPDVYYAKLKEPFVALMK